MQKWLLAFLLSPATLYSQLNTGLKAGINLVNVTRAAGINAGNRTGYLIGGFISPRPKKPVGFRSEIILSRQGYDYQSGASTGNLHLDYLLLPQLITFNFSKKFNTHAGAQAALLLNAAVDSSGGNSDSNSLFDYFNRFTFGLVAGTEVSPFSGFFIGSRLNISLNNLNKEIISGTPPSFIPRELIKK